MKLLKVSCVFLLLFFAVNCGSSSSSSTTAWNGSWSGQIVWYSNDVPPGDQVNVTISCASSVQTPCTITGTDSGQELGNSGSVQITGTMSRNGVASGSGLADLQITGGCGSACGIPSPETWSLQSNSITITGQPQGHQLDMGTLTKQ